MPKRVQGRGRGANLQLCHSDESWIYINLGAMCIVPINKSMETIEITEIIEGEKGSGRALIHIVIQIKQEVEDEPLKKTEKS